MSGHYDVLGVSTTATAEEIRAAYLALARRHHPDRLGDASPADRAQSAARMARINEAWSVLSDPTRRRVYDVGRAATGRDELGANVRDVGDTFRPFVEPDWADDIDPRLIDEPGRAVVGRSLAMFPAALAGVGVVLAFAGALLGLGGLFGFGVLVLAFAGVSFLGVPLIALLNAARGDGDP